MRLFLAGHNGMVGSAIHRKLKENKDIKILTANRSILNLERQSDVERFFNDEKPESVIIAAAKVGGINANDKYRAEFIYNNIQIQLNLIHTSYKFGVNKLLFLGSSCIYPKFCKQPMKEEYLLTGELEYTNEPYAVAKIAGIKLCESYYKQYGCNFISVMPTNLYGINDNFDLENSHVIPALIRKFHEAKENNLSYVNVWGSGKARREFMYVDDMAEACLHIFDKVDANYLYDELKISHINIGTGRDISINKVAEMIAEIVGYRGKIIYQTDKPDGHPIKLLDVTRLIKLGYEDKIHLKKGLKLTYDWYKGKGENSTCY